MENLPDGFLELTRTFVMWDRRHRSYSYNHNYNKYGDYDDAFKQDHARNAKWIRENLSPSADFARYHESWVVITDNNEDLVIARLHLGSQDGAG